MRFLGAKVVLTPRAEKGFGMYWKAVELAEANGWFLAHQFETEANALIHENTTAREILADFEGTRLDYYVSGYGTGGTVTGVGRILRRERPETKIILSEPSNAQLVGSGHPQERAADGSPTAGHPSFEPHPIQGWTPDFIPLVLQEAIDNDYFDELIPVSGPAGIEWSRKLAQREGIFTGISGGATFAVAMQIAERAEAGSTILCMLPDTGERYLSTPLFADVPVEMTDEELELSRSTPNYRFDAPPPSPAPQAAPVEPAPSASPRATEFVDQVITDRAQPVVLFALEWCEFCWSVRKMFAKYGIDYRSVDLDSVAYQADDWGGDIRNALRARTEMQTIPQIFIGGEFIGGATEVFDAWRAGRVQQLLEEHEVAFDRSASDDPYSFLPGWLHPR
jgi:cysteine synthase A